MKLSRPIAFLLFSLCCLILTMVGFAFYFVKEDGKIWWGYQDAGIMLRRGHYRAWRMRFMDGEYQKDGQRYPVRIFMSNNVQVVEDGRWLVPKFSHLDMKPFMLTPGSGIVVHTNASSTMVTIEAK